MTESGAAGGTGTVGHRQAPRAGPTLTTTCSAAGALPPRPELRAPKTPTSSCGGRGQPAGPSGVGPVELGVDLEKWVVPG